MDNAMELDQSVIEQPTTNGISRADGWKALAAMAVASVSDSIEGGLVNTLFPVIRQALGLGLEMLGILTSLSRFGRMIFGPAWSMAADRFGRKPVLVFVTGIWGLWTAAAGMAADATWLVILYGIGVIGTVASEPIANGLLADIFAPHERGKAYGFLRFISVGGGVLLTPFIGQLAGIQDGWRIGMYIMGGTSVLSGILIALWVKNPVKDTHTDEDKFKWADVAAIVKIPTVLLLAGMLPFVTSLVLFAFFVTYFVDVRKFSTQEAAILNTVFMAGFAISSFVGGLLGDWVTRKFGPNGRVALMQIYLVGFAVLSYLTLQIDWGNGPMLYIMLFIFGLEASIGFSGVVLPMVSSVVPADVSATAFSLLFSLVQGGISAVLSLSIGFIAKDLGLERTMLYLVTIPYAINAVYWFLFYRWYPGDVAKLQARKTAAAK